MTIRIDVYSHGFDVTLQSAEERACLLGYAARLAVFDDVWDPALRRKVRKVKEVYSTANKARTTFGFPIAELPTVTNYLRANGQTVEQPIIHTPTLGAPIQLPIKDGMAPKAEQIEIVDFLAVPDKTIRVLPLKTGGGKTASSIFAIGKLSVRTVLTMSNQHIVTWLREFDKFTDIDTSRIYMANSMVALEKLVVLAKDGEMEYDIVTISISILRNYITAYYAEGKTLDGVSPRELYGILGIGCVVTDESHENCHAVTVQAITMHVPRCIYLSATLIDDAPHVMEQYRKLFPMSERYAGGGHNDHAIVNSVFYSHALTTGMKYKGTRGYSHILYEDWLMEDPTRLRNYVKMLLVFLEDGYLKDYQENQVALFYFARVAMCDIVCDMMRGLITERLLEEHGHVLRINAYTGVTDESVLYSTDIILTTVGSCGTGKDIPNLVAAFAGIAIKSSKKNLQMLGRLRKPANYPGLLPKYYYFNCLAIPEHMKYAREKRTLFIGECAEQHVIRTNIHV